MAITPDNTRAVTTSWDKTARVWDLATGTETHTLTSHTDSVTAVAITPDGTRAVTASSDNTARVWDLTDGQYQQSVAMEPSATCLQTTQSDNKLTVLATEITGHITVFVAAAAD